MKLTAILAFGIIGLTVIGGVGTGIYQAGYGKGRADCLLAQADADAKAIKDRIAEARRIGEADAGQAGRDADADASNQVIVHAIPPNDAACLSSADADVLRALTDP